jgi:hypothetical protein
MLKKSLISTLALAVLLAFSGVPTLQAASVAGPGTKVQSEVTFDAAKMKLKKKKKYKKKYKKKSKAGKCGTYKYYSKKSHGCVDARDKK